MPAPSFTRSISLAGQGSVARSFSRSKYPSFSEASAPGAQGRPSRLELQAVLAHAQARRGAQAASHTNTNSDEGSLVGLGLPAELFPPALRDTQPRMAPMGMMTVSYAQSPLRGATSAPPTPPPTPPYPASPEISLARKAWPIDYDEADFSLPSTPASTPAEPTLRKPLVRPSLFMMPHFAREASQSKPLLGLGIIVPMVASPAEAIASAFPGPRTGPRRITEDLAADPIVTPSELMGRNFPLTPGAPMKVERHFPLTPGLPLYAAVTPASNAAPRDFHRTPGAPLFRQPSRAVVPIAGASAPQSLLEGLMANWGGSKPASRCSSSGGLSVNEDQVLGPTPLPTPAEMVDMYFI
ncbi:uncharacterized protein C8Q71DRAFT_751366 [Rhodofomes roseus]|uniref:Uncharacterized protein n=1 Tax=Rhodofomes roseus TaxID=34475 RepID=A0ABQ8KJY2_9APHY|nr:uncharacterized protein C8Q71DRAFT_751366 [Rhodofomes roseus]KAH9838457.1 hypothetical protein C8Q71DRAFT_751366 [Rhodofomes roseus]